MSRGKYKRRRNKADVCVGAVSGLLAAFGASVVQERLGIPDSTSFAYPFLIGAYKAINIFIWYGVFVATSTGIAQTEVLHQNKYDA